MAKEKPAAPAAKAAKASAKSITKAQFYAEVAEHTELPKAKVAEVFKAIEAIIIKQLGSKGPRVVTIPGLLKLKSKSVKAVKGGQKKINPLTKQEYVTKDKPASTKITARPLKGLKEVVK
jgi:nucleoid DNA-binding protein